MDTQTMSAENIEHLRAKSRGSVVLAGEIGYDELRRVWNGMIVRRPALVVEVLTRYGAKQTWRGTGFDVHLLGRAFGRVAAPETPFPTRLSVLPPPRVMRRLASRTDTRVMLVTTSTGLRHPSPLTRLPPP